MTYRVRGRGATGGSCVAQWCRTGVIVNSGKETEGTRWIGVCVADSLFTVAWNIGNHDYIEEKHHV